MPCHSSATARPELWSAYLLCRRYVAVYFSQVSLAGGSDVEREPVQHWAFGVLSDGQSEALGAWPQDRSGAMNWLRVFDDLKDRGVERIRFALSGDLASFREELHAAFPRATALPSFAQLLDRSVSQVASRHRALMATRLREIVEADSGQEARAVLAEFAVGPWGERYPALVADWRIALEQGWALWTVPLTLRRGVLSSDGAAAAMNRSLRKAVARRGCFADADEALRFVATALGRAGRLLDASRSGAVTEHNHHREGFRPRMDVLGV
jgi:putative transposase